MNVEVQNFLHLHILSIVVRKYKDEGIHLIIPISTLIYPLLGEVSV